MGLYIGSSKRKITLENTNFNLKIYIPSSMPVMNGMLLTSLDGYILKDINGLYLTAKEGE